MLPIKQKLKGVHHLADSVRNTELVSSNAGSCLLSGKPRKDVSNSEEPGRNLDLKEHFLAEGH